jgi:hypothetical protein
MGRSVKSLAQVIRLARLKANLQVSRIWTRIVVNGQAMLNIQ